MGNKSNAILQDSGAERAVLSAIATGGAEALFSVEDIICVTDFYWIYNQELFKIFSHLVHEENIKQFDLPTVSATAKKLGYTNYTLDGKFYEYLTSVIEEVGPNIDNAVSIATSIYKLSVARQGYIAANHVQKQLSKITGAENIDDIIEEMEGPIFTCTGKITAKNNSLSSIGKNFEQTMKALSECPQDLVGLPTGFPQWDMAIGGGLRPATVNIIGARPKIGKSIVCLNIARNIAECGVPVLYLDTELTLETQLQRLTSLVSGVDLNKIETGQFSSDPYTAQIVWGCQKNIEKMPIDHFSVAGMSPQAIISVARRWLSKSVGFMDSGAAKPCLIIYDYLKLMDDSGFKNGLQEFQLLGFLITALHNFAVKYRLPVLATVQLNRDGVDKEGSEVVSGSDRIVWLCSNFTILKKKSQAELNEDPPNNGTKKLVVTDTRYGPGMQPGEYINIKEKLNIAKFEEGQPFSFLCNNSLGDLLG